MQQSTIRVPESFQAFGRWLLEGEAGRRWPAALPDLVADQCARWGMRVDVKPRHGYNSLAVPVLRDGEPLVLKVSCPDFRSGASRTGSPRIRCAASASSSNCKD